MNLLNELAKDIQDKTGAEVLKLNFDVRSLTDVENAIDSLEGKWKNIDLLINNAGLAVGLGPVHTGLTDDWDRMIDTNVKGLLYMTRFLVPGMVSRGRGHVINIGSIAGHQTYPKGNVYCATKAAVKAISEWL